MAEDNILGDQFCSDLHAILGSYWRGYYTQALSECKRCLQDHGTKLEEWQRQFLESVEIYLRTWDQHRAYLKFAPVFEKPAPGGSDPEQWLEFYKNLLCVWLCCQERANLDLLQLAQRRAHQAATILTRIGHEKTKTLSTPLDKYPFFPRPWCIFWFRGITRHALGISDGALEDFARVHSNILRDGGYFNPVRMHGIDVRRQVILQYCCDKAKLASRFYNDLGMLLFDVGDMRTAHTVLELAVGIDKHSPYAWSNLGFVLDSSKKEDEALEPLLKAYQIATQDAKHSEDDFIVSGRIFYFLGVFAYRWLHKSADHYDLEVEKTLGERINALPAKDQKLFKSDGQVKALLAKAFRQYLRNRDLARALPALIVWSDPLLDDGTAVPISIASRRLLWELAHGMADFVASQVSYNKMVDRYLLPDILLMSKERDYV